LVGLGIGNEKAKHEAKKVSHLDSRGMTEGHRERRRRGKQKGKGTLVEGRRSGMSPPGRSERGRRCVFRHETVCREIGQKKKDKRRKKTKQGREGSSST